MRLPSLLCRWPDFCHHDKTESQWPHSIYLMACNVFRALAMSIQYAYVFGDILARNWLWYPFSIQSSSIQSKFIQISSRNAAHPQLFLKCFRTALRPVDKSEFHHVGRERGLRITHDLIWKPASGICLGICFTFLSEYLNGQHSSSRANLMAAAKILHWGGAISSVKTQAIYLALLGAQGEVQSVELNQFSNLLLGDHAASFTTKYPALLTSLKQWTINPSTRSLRQFLLDDLESKGEPISPELYSLVLELDACWRKKLHPDEKKYCEIHQAIMQTLAESFKLKLVFSMHLEGEAASLVSQLMNLTNGSYTIHLPNHALVCVKTDKEIAILDPVKGLSILSQDRQKEVLTHLLNYYGGNLLNSLKVSGIILPAIQESINAL